MGWPDVQVAEDPCDLQHTYIALHFNVQNVLALLDTGAKENLLFSNPKKFQGPTAIMDVYSGCPIHVGCTSDIGNWTVGRLAI
jgi:hypothetical protein